MPWIATAPLVLARGGDGVVQYAYRGQVIDDLTDEAATRLVSEGFVTALGNDGVRAVPAISQLDPVDVDAPPRTASTKVWREYAAAQGFDVVEAEAMNRQQLIEALG